jgi:transglutaminase-like putative cysteine protease
MVKTRTWKIPLGNPGHRVTVSLLQDLAVKASQDPVVIGFARRATQFAREKNPLEEAQGVLFAVQDAVRYTQDPITAELVADPRLLVRQIESGVYPVYGDCDDMAALTASLLMAIGYPVRFITYGKNASSEWEHIYLQMNDPMTGGWIDIDPIMKDKPLGWSPPSGNKVAFGAM